MTGVLTRTQARPVRWGWAVVAVASAAAVLGVLLTVRALTAQSSRAVVRILLPVLGVIVVAALGFAIRSTDSQPDAPTQPAGAPVESVATGSVTDQVRTSTVHGSHAGYDAAVKITQDAVGSRSVTALDIVLTTQATPASAPTAEASWSERTASGMTCRWTSSGRAVGRRGSSPSRPAVTD